MSLETIKKQIINKRTGIFRTLSPGFNYGSRLPIPMHVYRVTRYNSVDAELNIKVNSLAQGLGYSFNSKNQAEISAIGEGIERYSASIDYGHDFIYGSYSMFKGKYALDPSTVTRLKNEQIEIHKLKYVKADKDTPYNWVKAWDEINKKDTYVPTNLVFMSSQNIAKTFINPIREITSTGLAAGPNLTFAKEKAVLECIERDAISIMWLNQLSLPRLQLNSLKNTKIQRIIAHCESLGLEVVIIDISTDIKIPTYFVVLRNKFKKIPYVTFGAKSHYNSIDAIIGALQEAAMCFNYYSLNTNIDFVDINDVKKIRDFDDHLKYYTSGNGLENLEFLYMGEYINLDLNSERMNFDYILNQFKEQKIDCFTYELTTEDIRHLPLKVIRAITPQLAFLEVQVPMLNCKRIYEVPKRMGKNITNTINKNPHPFP